MNEFVWPAAVVLVATLAFVRLRPPKKPVAVKAKDFRQLALRVKVLEDENASLVTAHKKEQQAAVDQLAALKKEAAELVSDFAKDLQELKHEFSAIKNRAGLKAVVEQKTAL